MPPQDTRRGSIDEDDDERDQIHTSLTEPLLSSDESRAPPSRPAVSRNVHLTLVYTVLAFAGRSIWNQSVLATFVYLIRDNNAEAVGYITAVMGISQLISSFPAGIAADKYGRSGILKASSVVGLLAIGCTIAACRTGQYTYLTAALAVWGLFWGIASTTLSALFADSIPTGDRSHYFTKRSMLLMVGNSCGPASAMIMFAYLGDTWTAKDCAIVMAIGQTICLPAVLLLCFFRDQDTIQEDDENEEATSQDRVSSSMQDNDDKPNFLPIGPTESDEEAVVEDEDHEAIHRRNRSQSFQSDTTHETQQEGRFDLPHHRVIPVLIATADLVGGLGSGMSIRYFPIFFVNHLKLGPVHVQILYCVSPFLQAVLMKLAQRASRTHGRCHVATYFKCIGCVLMVAMVAVYLAGAPVWLVCVVYVMRTALVNSTRPLTRSMLMDHVPRHERGKWSSLESVNMFGWSGSAALGGVLVGTWGILPLFGFTAVVQFLATWPLVSLFARDVPESVATAAPATTTTTTRQATPATRHELTAP